MNLQDWIHKITEGSAAAIIRFLGITFGFVILAVMYNLHGPQSFPQEAMDTAQIARNVAEGKGYTTLSIRPLAVNLLRAHSSQPGKAISTTLLPEISTPPVYPVLLAGFLKAFPYQFTKEGAHLSSEELEYWIIGFNQALFFAAVLLLFFLARLLFDKSVAWLSASIFTATELYWRFSTSGLATPLLLVIFLAIALCLVLIEKRDDQKQGNLPLALAIGLLLGIGGLTNYSFIWLTVPVILFLYLGAMQQRAKLCLAVLLPLLLVSAPWLVRNYSLTGHCYGTAGFSIFQNTYIFPGDTLERSLTPQLRLTQVNPRDITDKFLTNIHSFFQNDLPKLGGSWLSAFFLVGILIPFRKKALSKIRYFLLGALFLLACVQAFTLTHHSDQSPAINSENLLIWAAPLAFVFGAALFLTLLDQLVDITPDVRKVCISLFGILVCAPFILYFLHPAVRAEVNSLDSFGIKLVSGWTDNKELMMSDVPSAVAWYGRRPCAWLTLNDGEDFSQFQAIAPIHSLYLTQKTTDHFLSRSASKANSWERFALECWTRKEVPDNFPLIKAPTGFPLDHIFLSDSEKWRMEKK